MTVSGAKGTVRGRAGGGEAGAFYERLLASLNRWGGLVSLPLLALFVAVGVYLRVIPALKYGLELDESDPWVLYWLAEYFLRNGLFSLGGLSDVKEFWYPYGRDFLTTESVGVPWLAAATYPIGRIFGLTLREWLALTPVFAGAAGILVGYLVGYKLTGSRLAGLVSALSMAVAPAAIVRTTVGFVEKMAISTPFQAMMIYFYYAAYTASGARRVAYSIAAGLSGGVVGWLWGGIHLPMIALALIIALDPLAKPPSLERLLRIHLPATLAFILASASYPAVGVDYYVNGAGVALVGALFLYVVAYSINSRLGVYKASFHLWLLAVAIVAGFEAIASGFIGVPGRIAAALGGTVLSPLVTSVQEHQPAYIQDILREAGFPLILAALGMAYDLYLAARSGALSERRLLRVSLYIVTFFMVYSATRMAYFMQLVGFYASITSGFIAGLIVNPEESSVTVKRKARREETIDSIRVTGALLVAMVVAAGGSAFAVSSYTQSEYRAPAIMTGMLPPLVYTEAGGGQRVVVPLNDAWLDALKWIKENTPEHALVVSWWDYGYWITVNTGRPTVADGSTLNETQIRLLALILTGTEDQASALLPMLGAKPNETYVVTYDVFHVIIDERGTAVIVPLFSVTQSPVNPNEYYVTYGRGDIPKSYQMLRIAWRINPFNSTPFNIDYSTKLADTTGKVYHYFPGFIGEPVANAERVREALIYKMMMYGIQNIKERGVGGQNCGGILGNATLVVPAVYASQSLGALPVYVTEFHRFELEAVAYDCIEGTVSRGALYDQATIVAVFIYKWLG